MELEAAVLKTETHLREKILLFLFLDQQQLLNLRAVKVKTKVLLLTGRE